MTHDHPSLTFALYMPIGAGDGAEAAALDTIESVVAHSRSLRWIVLVDDGGGLREATIRRVCGDCSIAILRNPRDGEGFGKTGGLCVANLTAYRHIQKHSAADFVLKLDSDSLVIAPFEHEVAAVLRQRPDAGLLGVIGDSFGENRTHRYAQYNNDRLIEVLGLPDQFAALAQPARDRLREIGVVDESHYRDFMRVREALCRAQQQGYCDGRYCQGGGYIVSRRLLDLMADADVFAEALIWRQFNIGEDLMMAVQCAAAGLCMLDVSQSGPRFAVQPFCVPLSRQELAVSGYSLVHSIRGDREPEIRAFFRERRAGDRSSRRA